MTYPWEFIQGLIVLSWDTYLKHDQEISYSDRRLSRPRLMQDFSQQRPLNIGAMVPLIKSGHRLWIVTANLQVVHPSDECDECNVINGLNHQTTWPKHWRMDSDFKIEGCLASINHLNSDRWHQTALVVRSWSQARCGQVETAPVSSGVLRFSG